MTQFLLNQISQPISLVAVDTNTTVLQFLRSNGLVGAKEGCASGDCGACTAVVIDLSADKQSLQFKSLNTCIALVHNLSGKWLLTVEGLQQNGKLHPVQQAMVDCHGSQCGYCTPGFIMSMYAWFVTHKKANLTEIEHCLGGNLCRCTGYQPIIESCYQAIQEKSNYQDNYSNIQALEKLKHFQQQGEQKQTHLVQEQTFLAPKTMTGLSTLIVENPKAKIVAGGTDLGLEITLFAKRFEKIISLQEVTDLAEIKNTQNHLEIRAGVTLNQALPMMSRYFPNVVKYLYRFAATQIRHWATLCGNIANASPIGDLPPVLLVLGAKLVLRQGEVERSIAIKDFFTNYKETVLQKGEWIKAIIMPKLTAQENIYAHKLSKRFEDDISTVSMAMKITLDAQQKHIQACDIAFGGMAAIPQRAPILSQMLVSRLRNQDIKSIKYAQIKDLSDDIRAAIKAEFTPLSDMRASAQYRLDIAAILVQRVLLEQTGHLAISVL